jgi:biopolymer transport protein ExbD
VASRGFLIRFIDIGLIVLFGFLMISDIEASSRVELADTRPDDEEPSVVEEERARAFVLVEIGGDGMFRLSDPLGEEAPTQVPRGPVLERELRRRIQAHAVQGLESVILIQPDPASVVQLTVDAMDVADRLGAAKSLQMDIEVTPPTGPDRNSPADSGAVPASAPRGVGAGAGR